MHAIFQRRCIGEILNFITKIYRKLQKKLQFLCHGHPSLSNFGQLIKLTHAYFAEIEMNQPDYPPLKFLLHLTPRDLDTCMVYRRNSFFSWASRLGTDGICITLLHFQLLVIVQPKDSYLKGGCSSQYNHPFISLSVFKFSPIKHPKVKSRWLFREFSNSNKNCKKPPYLRSDRYINILVFICPTIFAFKVKIVRFQSKQDILT